MKVIRSIKEMNEVSEEQRLSKNTIGFVPTMGFLHEGHLALVEQAKKDTTFVVVSVFVNPLQFNQATDLEKYPRDFERDEKILSEAGVDAIFYPSVDDMYPKSPAIQMNLVDRGDVLCGATRPGHFEGVLTVLSKLFNIIRPTHTFFGLKDAQQVAVVDSLINDLNFDIKLVPVPTVREDSGLAKSSRNVNLNPAEREEAANIYRSLLRGREELMNDNEWTREQVINTVNDFLQNRISGEIDYIDCLTYPELKSDNVKNHDIIIAVAVKYQYARLIDNVILHPNGQFKYGGD
ncbi:pantoate--beta-alanine ligase [Halalkalibacillus sediminis]|uniref:Pantothenate synthetase n=1 Tax=Halalkalibacillus sediminis TaxID=2018042 RepID=A0A2I0QWZ4_9BACI|nr:pantoate--beta-alanine ligase [Halalkalibacillus sediminis]PKR78828.1 pantoate--beta-alanine ligase [Halalkalibacillus sediminis]